MTRAAATERERDALRKRAVRAAAKDVAIPRCEDRQRRERLEADTEAWLSWYYGEDSGTPDPFWYAFTDQQKQMIQAIDSAMPTNVGGGDQALASSRGEGKTTYFERVLTKYALAGVLHFSVLLQATGSLAEASLDSIKLALETNTRLAADYPEVCVPIAALENTPSRAHYMTVSGQRHDNGQQYSQQPARFKWCGKEVILPVVPGSPAAGAIIATRGLDGAIRGLKKRGRRVDLVGIDDPDTERTAESEVAAKKLERRIDRGLSMLGGQQKAVSRVMLTTLQSRTSVSYLFTDPVKKPSWKGRRFRFLLTPPASPDLWDEYVQLRQADLLEYALGKSDDRHCRRSHGFYLERRATMDAGAAVANEHRFDPTVLPDGSQVEVSALERYYNEVARIGPEAVATEFDNDPPEEAAAVDSGITPHLIQRRVNGYKRREVPPATIKLTRGVDVRKVALHWVVRAWRSDGSGFTLDYGVHEIHGTVYGSDEGVDEAIRRGILDFLETSRDWGYAEGDGKRWKIDRTLIDAGYRTEAVYAACREAGLGVSPVMGFGRSSGCVQANFAEMQRQTRDRKPGNGFFLSRKGKLWLVCADADRWKAWEHDRWLTAPQRPGSMTLFGEPGPPDGKRLSADEKSHFAYARHISNEVEREIFERGAIRRRFECKSANVHWLDASYYADVAASIEGVPIVGSTAALVEPAEPPPPSLEELARRAKG